MTPQEVFAAWAPPDRPWSAWAKPVVFANLRYVPGEDPPADASAASGSPADPMTAVVVDLPGPRSVLEGVGLALRGWQPVPLFNGNWGPAPSFVFTPAPVIDLAPLLRALRANAEVLRANPAPTGAPPAFLLDALRMSGGDRIAPGRFDNRWMTFPQDFPSAAHLLRSGVRRAVVIQEGDRIAEDLTHVLLRWREAGMEVLLQRWGNGLPLVAAPLAKPSRFRRTWYRVLATFRLRRSLTGGFGGVVPDPNAAG